MLVGHGIISPKNANDARHDLYNVRAQRVVFTRNYVPARKIEPFMHFTFQIQGNSRC
jgi:hypothetical protein